MGHEIPSGLQLLFKISFEEQGQSFQKRPSNDLSPAFPM